MRLCRDAALCPLYLTRSRLTEERALSRRQLMLVHSPLLRWLARPLLPKGWTANSFRTAGDVDAQRVALRTLGTRLAVVSILSFLCKSASVATSYFARDVIADSAQLESIIFLATALAVQAVPSAATLLLLGSFLFSRGSDGSDALMQSLLTRDGVSVAVASDSEASAARQGQHATELAAEVSRLQAENAQLRAKAEQASRLQEENAQQRAQMAALQQSHQKLQEANQMLQQSHQKVQEANQKLEQSNQKLEQANQRSQDEVAQLRLDVARILQQVATLIICVCACLAACIDSLVAAEAAAAVAATAKAAEAVGVQGVA